MNNAQPTARLRKYIPQPARYEERHGVFTLTERDLEILQLVYEYRHLESRHIRALIGGSDQKITRRLQGLFHNRYLARYVPRQRMRADLDKGSPLIAYGLERNGWRALAERSGNGVGEDGNENDAVRWKKEYTRRMEWFLEHAVMRSNFRTVLQLGLRETPAGEARRLHEWDQSDELQVQLTMPSGKRIGLVPDAYFAIEEGDGTIRNYFLEADRGSEAHPRIVAKYRAYWWYLQSQAYREAHYDPERVQVLFVTTGEQRMRNMMRSLNEMEKPNRPPYGGKGWFRFCLEEDYDLEDPATMFDPIWRTVTKPDEMQALA